MTITSQEAKDITPEVADKAYSRAKSLLPVWAPLVRAIARNPKLKVTLTAGAPRTNGREVWLQVPIELGVTEHIKGVCGQWDAAMTNYLCPACKAEMEVDMALFHEVAHLTAGTFSYEQADDELVNLLRDRYPEVAHRFDTVSLSRMGKRGFQLRRDVDSLTVKIGERLPNPFGFQAFNALEDVFVNARIIEARPGLDRIFAAAYSNVFADGGDVWRQRHPFIQSIMIVMLLAMNGDELADEYFDPAIVAKVRSSDVLLDIAANITDAALVSDRWKATVHLLNELDRLGLGYERKEPEPGEGDKCEEGEPSKSDDADPTGQSETDPTPDADDDDELDTDGAESDDADGEGGEPSGGTTKEVETSDSPATAPQPGSDADEDDDESDDEAGGAGNSDDSESDDDPSEGDDDTGGAEDGDDSDADEDDDTDATSSGAGADEDDGDDDGPEDGDGDPVGSSTGEGTDTDSDDGAPGENEGDEDGEADDENTSTGPSNHAPGSSEAESSDWEDDDGSGIGDDHEESFDGEAANQQTATGADVTLDPLEAAKAFEALTGHEHFGDLNHAEEALGQDMEEPDEEVTELVEGAITFDGYLEGNKGNIVGLKFDYERRSYSRHPLSAADFRLPASVRVASAQQMRQAFAANRKVGVSRNLTSGTRIDRKTMGHRIPAGDDRIFSRRTIPKKRDWTVLVGIDVSGSTNDGAINTEKVVAMGLGDLFTEVGIPFSMYAHTGDGGNGGFNLIIFPVKEVNTPWEGAAKNTAAALTPAKINLDGHTMQAYRKMLERQRGKDKLLIYFTDGEMPNVNYADEAATLSNECAIMKRSGLHVVGVGIGTDSPRQHGLDTIEVNGVEDIPRLLTGIGQRLTR